MPQNCVDPPAAAQLPGAPRRLRRLQLHARRRAQRQLGGGQHDGHGDGDRRLPLPLGRQPRQPREPRRRLHRARSPASITPSTAGSTGCTLGGAVERRRLVAGRQRLLRHAASASPPSATAPATRPPSASGSRGRRARTPRARTWSTRSPSYTNGGPQNDISACQAAEHPALGLQGRILDPPGHRPRRPLLPRHAAEQARV